MEKKNSKLLKTDGYPITLDRLNDFEGENGFTYPTVLSDFYLNHYNAKIYEKEILIQGNEYSIVRFIYPFESPEMVSVELLLRENEKNTWFDSNHIPFASDWGDDLYCFDINDSSVWLYFPDSDVPIRIIDDVDLFFEKINE